MTRARDISRLLGRTDNEVDSEGEIIGTAGQIVDSAYILSQTPSSTGFTFYNTLDSLPSNADAGSLAFVEANTRMYLNDGSGWYSIAAVNLSPSLTLSPSGAIELATDGSASTVTITATDTDDPSAILSYSVESDGNMKATGTTVTQDSSVFTITPLTEAGGGVAGNFTLSFKVSDQIDEAVANKSFSLAFQSTGTLTSSASSVNEGSSVTFTLPVTGYSDGDTFPYTITGIQAADLNPATLSGNMTVSGNNATKTITTVADTTTEGAQTMTFSANSQSVNVTINDTSVSPPTYSLSQSPSYATPGNVITYTLTTTNVANGTTIPYTIGNKSPYQQYGYAGSYGWFEPGNSGSIYGSFTVNNNTATASETIRSVISRTGPATYNLALNNGGANIDTQVRTNATLYSNLQNSNVDVGGSNLSGNQFSYTVTTHNHAYNRMVVLKINVRNSGNYNANSAAAPSISWVKLGQQYMNVIQSGNGGTDSMAAIAYLHRPSSTQSTTSETVTIRLSSSMTTGRISIVSSAIYGGLVGYPQLHSSGTATLGYNGNGTLSTNVNTVVNSGDNKYHLVAVATTSATSASNNSWVSSPGLNGGWGTGPYGTIASADNESNYTYYGNYSSRNVKFTTRTYAGGGLVAAVFK